MKLLYETSEPNTVKCHKCNGLGKIRITFASVSKWRTCEQCLGIGQIPRLRYEGSTMIEIPADLASKRALKRQEVKTANSLMNRHRKPQTLQELKAQEQRDSMRGPKQKRIEIMENSDTVKPENLSPDLRCDMCEQRALIQMEGQKLCANHGKEKFQP